MKKLHAVTAAVALCLASTLAVAQTKLKWAHVYETTEPYHTAAVWAAGEIKKRTAGRYDVEVFPASTLGKETDINQGLTLGTVDIIYTGQLFAGRTYGPLAIGGAPYMFRDFDHWKRYSTSPFFGSSVTASMVARRASTSRPLTRLIFVAVAVAMTLSF